MEAECVEINLCRLELSHSISNITVSQGNLQNFSDFLQNFIPQNKLQKVSYFASSQIIIQYQSVHMYNQFNNDNQQNYPCYPSLHQQNQQNQNLPEGYHYPPPQSKNNQPLQTYNYHNTNPNQVSDIANQQNLLLFQNDSIQYGTPCKTLRAAEFHERKGFIFKVYSLLSFQLLITFGVVMISYFSDGFRDILVDPYTYEGQPLLWVCLGISLVTLFAMFCYRNLSQKFPSNFIAFFIFTLSFSFLVAGCCAVCYDLFDNGGLIVLSASLLTLAITLALTLYAWTTKKDFTLCGAALWIVAVTLLMMSILSIFFYEIILQLFICSVVIVAYGFYLIYDTQLIMGGKAHGLSIDDYILGAMIIYIDIMILFLRILRILMILCGNKQQKQDRR